MLKDLDAFEQTLDEVAASMNWLRDPNPNVDDVGAGAVGALLGILVFKTAVGAPIGLLISITGTVTWRNFMNEIDPRMLAAEQKVQEAARKFAAAVDKAAGLDKIPPGPLWDATNMEAAAALDEYFKGKCGFAGGSW
jgi:hypothetical protein